MRNATGSRCSGQSAKHPHQLEPFKMLQRRASAQPTQQSVRVLLPASMLCPTSQLHRNARPVAVRTTRRVVLSGVIGVATLLLSKSAEGRLEPINAEVPAAQSPLIQELLRRTEEHREERIKERLNDYYKRNFKEYFEFEAGNIQTGRARGLSEESTQAILQWLERNRDPLLPTGRRQAAAQP